MTIAAAVIGDVHGEAGRLAELISILPGRRLVFVGDLVNRGPDTRLVLDTVARLAAAGSAVLIAGNHERALLSYWRGEKSFVEFALMGGLATLKSYLPEARGDVWAQFRTVFPEGHRALLEGALDEFWLGDALVRHWHADAEIALATKIGSSTQGRPLVVGHTVVNQAKRIGDVVLLDSGCGTSGGALSAFLWPEQTFVSTAGDSASGTD